MDWLRKRLVWGAMLVSLAGALAACEEGPAENVGEEIDEQGEEATTDAGSAAAHAAKATFRVPTNPA